MTTDPAPATRVNRLRKSPSVPLQAAITSAASLSEWTADRSLDDYVRDDVLRSAIERQVTVLGRALAGVSALDASLLPGMAGGQNVVDQADELTQAYWTVDDRDVWQLVTTTVPAIHDDLLRLTTVRDDTIGHQP